MCRRCFREYADDIGFKKVSIIIIKHIKKEREIRFCVDTNYSKNLKSTTHFTKFDVKKTSLLLLDILNWAFLISAGLSQKEVK